VVVALVLVGVVLGAVGASASSGLVPAGSIPAGSTASGSTASTCSVAIRLASWSTERLAEETVVVPVDAGNLASVSAEVRAGVGGIILLGSLAPGSFPAQLRALVGVARGGVAPLVMLDEEGGSVQRIPNLLGEVPSARQMGATMTPAAIASLSSRLGTRLRSIGVTMDLAPVLDVDGGAGPDRRDPDGTRSFSATASVAAADGVAFASGLVRAGVVPVVKHFPGLGGASGNTDFAPASTPPLATLDRVGLVPFEAAISAGLPAVMVSSASVPGLTSEPADLSPAVVEGLLRRTLGFRGLVLTDALSTPSVRAAGYSTVTAAVAALRAGGDLVLFSAPAGSVGTTTSGIVSAVVAAIGHHQLARSRLVRAVADILVAKDRLPPCPP